MKDKHFHTHRRLIPSFKYAFQGISYAIKNEKNFRIHLVIAILVIIIGFICNLSYIEWLFIITAIFGVLALELVNSAIERAVDLVTMEVKLLAKQAKDLAAAAVLAYAFFAVIIGVIILLPKIIQLISIN